MEEAVINCFKLFLEEPKRITKKISLEIRLPEQDENGLKRNGGVCSSIVRSGDRGRASHLARVAFQVT